MKNGRFKINLFLGVLPKFRFILNLRLMADFVVYGRYRESDHIRCILLNRAFLAQSHARCRVVGICGLRIVSRGDLTGIWVTLD
jgi:hypothetical protein